MTEQDKRKKLDQESGEYLINDPTGPGKEFLDEVLTMDPANEPDPADDKRFFGHPKGLAVLFLTEIWERFSYYGMRALLVLYIIKEFYSQYENKEEIAYGIFASYGALVYCTPIIGGFIADRFIGHKRAVTVGSIIMAIGHILMAFPSEIPMFLALGMLIIGNGFFKPNIGTLVGNLYSKGDVRRDAGFTIFYMGVNIGAFLSPLLCGLAAKELGTHYGFGLAGLGMIIGLGIFWYGIKAGLVKSRVEPEIPATQKNLWSWGICFTVAPLSGLLIYANEFVFTSYNVVGWLLFAMLAVILTVIIYNAANADKVTAQRLIVIPVLALFITVFWAVFEQAGTSLTVFADEHVHLGWMTAEMTNSINPGWIMLLAIPFASMWVLLSKKKLNPRTPTKFALGMVQLGIGFLIFALSARYADSSFKTPLLFLIIGYLFVTTGELFMSPIGLSKTTELAPGKLVAFMVGVYYFSSAFGHLIAGGIAKMTVAPAGTENWLTKVSNLITGLNPLDYEAGSSAQSLAQASGIFASIFVLSMIVALIVFLSAPVLKRWMHGVH